MPQAEYLQFGGQAVPEGVMMRSPRYFAVACRAPNGEIVLQTEPLEKTWIGRQKWLKLPFLRGSLALLDSMALGIKSMRFASNIQLDPKYQPADEQAEATTQNHPSEKIQEATVIGAMVVGLALGFFLFNVLPNTIAEFLSKLGLDDFRLKNLLTEFIKVIFFLGYIWLIGRMEAIREIFKYHGAEHKAINTMEAHQDLNLSNCQQQTRLHPRCGTSFAVIVLIVSMFLFTFVPRYPITGKPDLWYIDVPVRVILELMILPLIAGLSYELLRLAGKFRNQLWVNVAFRPGLWTQYLTTVEPNEGQIEVALLSLKAVVRAEETGECLTDPAALLADGAMVQPAAATG